jgi:aryl-alcohol dehydrogenase-like predicted oxidoreductase
LQYRRLGKTDFLVSEVGFGAWGIGKSFWVGARDEESMAALHAAVDAGVNVIDTALVYGQGHSEALIGQLVRARSERIYVATKIPPLNQHWPAFPGDRLQETFPPSYIIESTEQSLRHLKLDCIDLQQLHVWRDEWAEDPSWQDAFAQLKAEGKIRAIGVSINDHEPETALRLVQSGHIDTVQVIYNVFDQSPAHALFPACLKHDVGILARCPFDEGSLTGSITPQTVFPEGDWRNDYFRDDRKTQVAERLGALSMALGEEAGSLPELALRFCLSHPAVGTVIPGMRTSHHVHENVAVSDGRRLSSPLLSLLTQHAWDKNFYD